MEDFHKNIQLMMYFLKASFLALHFSCNTSMTFLTMLSVILLYMLMILLSILSVIRHPICDNSLNWLLNLNMIYETLWNEVKSGFLISMLKKLKDAAVDLLFQIGLGHYVYFENCHQECLSLNPFYEVSFS